MNELEIKDAGSTVEFGVIKMRGLDAYHTSFSTIHTTPDSLGV